MFSESNKPTTAERIEAVVNLIYQNEADIMGSAALPQELWEQIMAENILGEIHPTKIVVRAIITQILTRKNRMNYWMKQWWSISILDNRQEEQRIQSQKNGLITFEKKAKAETYRRKQEQQ